MRDAQEGQFEPSRVSIADDLDSEKLIEGAIVLLRYNDVIIK